MLPLNHNYLIFDQKKHSPTSMFLRIQPRWRPGGLGLLHHCGCYWGRWCKASWGCALDEKLSNSPVNLWNGTFFILFYNVLPTSLVHEFHNLESQILTNISTNHIRYFWDWIFMKPCGEEFIRWISNYISFSQAVTNDKTTNP